MATGFLARIHSTPAQVKKNTDIQPGSIPQNQEESYDEEEEKSFYRFTTMTIVPLTLD